MELINKHLRDEPVRVMLADESFNGPVDWWPVHKIDSNLQHQLYYRRRFRWGWYCYIGNEQAVLLHRFIRRPDIIHKDELVFIKPLFVIGSGYTQRTCYEVIELPADNVSTDQDHQAKRSS
jgi:hypothetical protein